MLKLPHLPDMIFPNNSVVITHADDPELRISFSAFDALQSVDVTSYPDVEVKLLLIFVLRLPLSSPRFNISFAIFMLIFR